MQGSRKRGEGVGWRINPTNGYRQCTRRGKNCFRYEHVLVVEKRIGRRIRYGEIVHHINGNKIDNRIENLELMTNSAHMKEHMSRPEIRRKSSRIAKRTFATGHLKRNVLGQFVGPDGVEYGG